MSDDGRFVAFTSRAPLTATDQDTASDVFVRDRLEGTLELVSIGSDGEPIADDVGLLGMSGDGSVVFLIERLGDPPPEGIHWDRFRVLARDRVTGTTRELVRDVVATDASANAAWLAYVTEEAPPLVTRVYLRNTATGVTTEVATAEVAFAVAVADPGDVAFDTTASLLPVDVDGDWDTYLWTRSTGSLEIVSKGPEIESGRLLDLAADGSAVAFFSHPDEGDRGSYAVWDRIAESATVVGRSADPEFSFPAAAVSVAPRFVAYTWTRPSGVMPEKIRLVDLETGSVERVDANDGGLPCRDRWSMAPWLSPDARFVGFSSDCSWLVPDDTNDATDAFVRDRATPAPTALPDLALNGGGRWVGLGALVHDPEELATSVSAVRVPVTLWASARIRNSGNADGGFLLAGGTGRRWTRVAYLVEGADVTGSVVAGTFRTPILQPGQAIGVQIRIRLAPGSGPCRSSRIALRTSSPGGWVDAGLLFVDAPCGS